MNAYSITTRNSMYSLVWYWYLCSV